MTLHPYTRSREGQAASAEQWLQPLPGGPLREETLSLLLQHARSSGYGSHFFSTSVCLRDDLSPTGPKETPMDLEITLHLSKGTHTLTLPITHPSTNRLASTSIHTLTPPPP